MPIKGIFFDAADVFYRRPEPTDNYVLNLLKQNGYATELSAGKHTDQKALRTQANRGCINHEVFWDQFLLIHGVAAPEQRKTLIGQIIDYSNHVLAIPGGREAMAGLKQRGFILGIVTDTVYPIEWKMRWLDQVGVAEFIDVVACSTVLGAHKPDPAIYLDALQQAHLTPSESAFVGHDAGELAGARQAGIATVAVNYDPGAQADYYARSLVDLLNVPIFQGLAGHSQRQKPARPTVIASGSEAIPHVEEIASACGPRNDGAIQVIFIDVGATLRVLVKDEPYQAQARQQIATLVGTPESPAAFCEELDTRYKVYRKWAFETLLEASEKDLWTRWLLPDFPPDKIAPLSGELTFLYRQTMGHRHAQPDAKQVVVELTRRGYRLGILSNTITEREIPQWLVEDGLSPYFPTVILSSVFGRRKPGPEIYLEAARQAGVDPAQAAYVGDNPARDVLGARKAGFGMVIIMPEPKDKDEPIAPENKPDLIIHKLSDLLDYFPAR